MNYPIDKQQHLFTVIQPFIEQICRVKTEVELVKICTEITNELELSYFSHGLMWADDFHHPHFKIISNYEKKWLDEYDNCNYYQIDPRAKACMKSMMPVFWNTEKPYLDTLPTEAREMMENAHEHQVGSGVTAPIFSSQNSKGAFGFGLKSDSILKNQEGKLELISPFVNYLGVFVHQAIISLLKLETNDNTILLSEREKDCLCWAADGKTTSEIASSLYLSESTIKYHFKNAMVKLNARNTSQALSIAITKGYIQPILSVN